MFISWKQVTLRPRPQNFARCEWNFWYFWWPSALSPEPPRPSCGHGTSHGNWRILMWRMNLRWCSSSWPLGRAWRMIRNCPIWFSLRAPTWRIRISWAEPPCRVNFKYFIMIKFLEVDDLNLSKSQLLGQVWCRSGDVWGHGPEKCCCFLSFSHSRIFTFQIKHLWNRLICKPWMDKIWIFWRLTTVSYSFMIWIFKAFESCTDTLFRTVRPGGGSREIKSQPFAADYSRCPRAFLTCNHQSQRWCDSEIHFWFLHLQFDDFMTWVLDSFHRCSLACPESVVSRFQDSRPKFGVT